ncbi:MAG: hypothetical protein AAF337_03025, partial [Pseudomonadota bacterium]
MGIVSWVLGIETLLGWELGSTESVAGVILIGFSVDYVVHLAEFYCHSSKGEDRVSKTQESLAAIGISILGGSVTTLGAGFFLFFTTIIFFQKFAILLVTTISTSFLWSNFFFTSALSLVGPTGSFG